MGKNKQKNKKLAESKAIEEAEEAEETKEESEEETVEEKPSNLPEFINNVKDVKIKLVDGKKHEWITVKKGQTINLSRKIALANGFEEVQ